LYYSVPFTNHLSHFAYEFFSDGGVSNIISQKLQLMFKVVSEFQALLQFKIQAKVESCSVFNCRKIAQVQSKIFLEPNLILFSYVEMKQIEGLLLSIIHIIEHFDKKVQ